MAKTPSYEDLEQRVSDLEAVYLPSAASDFVTGVTIRVDGGYAIR